MDSMPKIIALETFTQQMGVAPSTAWRWRKQGILETVNLHGRMYVTHEQAAKFVSRVASGEFSKAPRVPPPPRRRRNPVNINPDQEIQ